MNIIKSEQIRPFDVDGTLIIPIDPNQQQLIVKVHDPITGKYVKVAVHEPMVRILKEENHRGGHIVVWSRSGYEWAANVVRALDLVPYVHTVMSKPQVYFDDVKVSKWLRDRVFLEPNMQYKRPITN